MSTQVGLPIAKGTHLVLEAAAFEAGKHRDQRRQDAGALPYINHPWNANAALHEGNDKVVSHGPNHV